MSASTLRPLTPRNRLEPLAALVTWVFWFAVAAAVLRVILALLGRGPLAGAHIGGPGPSLPGVCLSAPWTLLEHTGSGLPVSGLSPGVHGTVNAANLCAVHPTAGQNLAFTLTLLPIDLLRLGWWLLPGGLAATVTEAFARLNLLGQLVTWNSDWGQWPVAWSVDWPVAWTGIGLIIFARIMRTGAVMRADLEGTV